MQNYYESCTNKCNNKLFRLMSNVYPDSHKDFMKSHELFETELVKLPIATSNKIKDKVSEACNKVSLCYA